MKKGIKPTRGGREGVLNPFAAISIPLQSTKTKGRENGARPGIKWGKGGRA